MKQMTLREKMTIVNGNKKMHEEYCKRVAAAGIKSGWGNVKNTIKGRVVGIQTIDNALKYVAQSVYDEFCKKVN